MYLYQIPKESKIQVDTEKGKQLITFHNLDGMYSYCTVDAGEPDESEVVHLKVTTPLEKKETENFYTIDYSSAEKDAESHTP